MGLDKNYFQKRHYHDFQLKVRHWVDACTIDTYFSAAGYFIETTRSKDTIDQQFLSIYLGPV